jgi:hypothetical protein
MSWETAGAIAGGLLSGYQESQRKKQLNEYQKASSDYYKERAEEIRQRRLARTAPRPSPGPAVDNSDNALEYADGGLIESSEYAGGGVIGTITMMTVASASGYERNPAHSQADHYWQKQSFKK